MHRVLALVLAAGCAPTSYTYTPSVRRGPQSRPEGCAVDVMTSPPEKRFEEVGTLDFYNGTEPTTVEGFKRAVAKQVCQVGGDAVIAIVNEKLQFTKGTVIRYIP
jgi:hypothetical protein